MVPQRICQAPDNRSFRPALPITFTRRDGSPGPYLKDALDPDFFRGCTGNGRRDFVGRHKSFKVECCESDDTIRGEHIIVLLHPMMN